jgi:hypothetical protein
LGGRSPVGTGVGLESASGSREAHQEVSEHGLKEDVGYKLVSGGCFPAMLDPSSPVLERAGVIGHTIWVPPSAHGHCHDQGGGAS